MNTAGGYRILGTLSTDGGRGVVRMEDRFSTGIEDVWSALTDNDRLADWWGVVEGEISAGGEFHARLHASGWEGTGRVEVFEPPRRLRIVSAEPDQAEMAHVREVTLTTDGGETVLIWEERGMPVELLAAYGAGIQIHVEDLGAHLSGRPRCDANARWDELEPLYVPLSPVT